MANKEVKTTAETKGQKEVMGKPIPAIFDELYDLIAETKAAGVEARQAAEAARLAASEAETKGLEAAAAAKKEAADVASGLVAEAKIDIQRQLTEIWDSIGKLNDKITKLATKVNTINDAVIAGVDAFNAVIKEQ